MIYGIQQNIFPALKKKGVIANTDVKQMIQKMQGINRMVYQSAEIEWQDVFTSLLKSKIFHT